MHLHRTGATGNTLAARLIHAEFHEEPRHIDHLRRVVHHNHSTRTHDRPQLDRSEEHTSELQSQSFISYAVFCLKKNNSKSPTASTPAPAAAFAGRSSTAPT